MSNLVKFDLGDTAVTVVHTEGNQLEVTFTRGERTFQISAEPLKLLEFGGLLTRFAQSKLVVKNAIKRKYESSKRKPKPAPDEDELPVERVAVLRKTAAEELFAECSRGSKILAQCPLSVSLQLAQETCVLLRSQYDNVLLVLPLMEYERGVGYARQYGFNVTPYNMYSHDPRQQAPRAIVFLNPGLPASIDKVNDTASSINPPEVTIVVAQAKVFSSLSKALDKRFSV